MDDYVKSKERSHADSITACVWLFKGFTMLVAAGLIYQAVAWFTS